MNVDNEYEEDYYESSDFDMIHFDEEYSEDNGAKLTHPTSPTPRKKKLLKKKRRLEDWLEEKRLRDVLRDESFDSHS